MKQRTYLAIDLKSFYASSECVERGLDPLTTNLVVADESRTEKTICLAVSPSLKAYGIPGRPRLFEVIQKINSVNESRRKNLQGKEFAGSSWNDIELKSSPNLAVDYIVAPPRMAHYIEQSTKIYGVYLKYVAPEDMHVYSIDEVFMDITNYLPVSSLSPREFAMQIILDVLKTTGITATAGIGPNLYLSKIAMDIVAKHIHPDKNGVRIAKLDEISYRRLLWDHKPLTDFWRVGKGYVKRLESKGLYTMGDIARCSIGAPTDFYNEDLLYDLFGINAELLIDHSWGWEPCTIADIKTYKPSAKSVGSGQVLQCSYTFDKAKIVVNEMANALSLDLVRQGLMTNQLELSVGYDIENLKGAANYSGEIKSDHYGRSVPKPAHGTINLEQYTSSSKQIISAVLELYERIVNKNLLVRRLNLSANKVLPEEDVPMDTGDEQLDLFTNYQAEEEKKTQQAAEIAKERKKQKAILAIQEKFGRNAIMQGISLEEGATAKERNQQIGGHKA